MWDPALPPTSRKHLGTKERMRVGKAFFVSWLVVDGAEIRKARLPSNNSGQAGQYFLSHNLSNQNKKIAPQGVKP